MSHKRIIVGCDHGGFALKQNLVEFIKGLGWSVEDIGCNSTESVDYPEYARKVSRRVAADPDLLGVLICGTGVGMSMAANKVRGVRAALCSDTFSAEMTRRHNDANVLCLGGRVLGVELARVVTQAFLQAEFEGGRHKRRVDQFCDGK